jgi:hypothetical protein
MSRNDVVFGVTVGDIMHEARVGTQNNDLINHVKLELMEDEGLRMAIDSAICRSINNYRNGL